MVNVFRLGFDHYAKCNVYTFAKNSKLVARQMWANLLVEHENEKDIFWFQDECVREGRTKT